MSLHQLNMDSGYVWPDRCFSLCRHDIIANRISINIIGVAWYFTAIGAVYAYVMFPMSVQYWTSIDTMTSLSVWPNTETLTCISWSWCVCVYWVLLRVNHPIERQVGHMSNKIHTYHNFTNVLLCFWNMFILDSAVTDTFCNTIIWNM